MLGLDKRHRRLITIRRPIMLNRKRQLRRMDIHHHAKRHRVEIPARIIPLDLKERPQRFHIYCDSADFVDIFSSQ